MNCSLAGHLIDEYLDNRLSWAERQRLEAHLTSCPGCRADAESRAHLEREAWRALVVSVQCKNLSSGASARIVREAQHALRRSVVRRRIGLVVRAVSSVAVIVLVSVVAILWLARSPWSPYVERVIPPSVRQWLVSDREQGAELTANETPPAEIEPDTLLPKKETGLSISSGESLIEPNPLRPGDPFSIIAYVGSNMPGLVGDIRFDVEITGPTGQFRFPMRVKGPFPDGSVSVLQVTSTALDRPSQVKYRLPASDIFRVPGMYIVRVVLYSPELMAEQ